jgi:uncharacterized tellurite resistance protein B-like protein
MTLLIIARADDYKVELQSGKTLPNSTTNGEFSEYWTFIRRPGAKTSLNSNGLIEGHCPNCGTGIVLNAGIKCGTCGSLIKNGQYDWVLTEITQASEWKARDDSAISGVDQIHSLDAGFSIRHLEDRTSVMFWRYIKSLRLGKIKPIHKMATNDFCHSLLPKIRPNADGDWISYDQCAIGTVETQEIKISSEFDRAFVLVKWSGHTSKKSAHGSYNDDSRQQVLCIKNYIFVLKRVHGVKTNVQLLLTSTNCASCGAPITDIKENACEYCDAILNDGSHDWTLEYIGLDYDQNIKALRNNHQFEFTSSPGETIQSINSGNKLSDRTPSNSKISQTSGLSNADATITINQNTGGIELIAWMISLMLADQSLNDEELQMIHAYATTRGVNHTFLNQLITSAQSGQLQPTLPESRQQLQNMFSIMAELALVDGFIATEEKDIIQKLGKKLNFTRFDVDQLIAKKRKELYHASKQAIRQLRVENG